jgi:hypothetical protein
MTLDELGFNTADELLAATADHVIDEALLRFPSDSTNEKSELLWSICERFLVAPRLGQRVSSEQWMSPAGRRLATRLGGPSVAVDLVLGLMTAWWEPIVDPATIVSDPSTGRPVDLGRVLAQHSSAIGRFGGRHFAEADDELRLWCLYASVASLLPAA